MNATDRRSVAESQLEKLVGVASRLAGYGPGWRSEINGEALNALAKVVVYVAEFHVVGDFDTLAGVLELPASRISTTRGQAKAAYAGDRTLYAPGSSWHMRPFVEVVGELTRAYFTSGSAGENPGEVVGELLQAWRERVLAHPDIVARAELHARAKLIADAAAGLRRSAARDLGKNIDVRA